MVEPNELARRVVDEMLAHDETSQSLGIAVESCGVGNARLRMVVRDDMVNGHGICHGGMIFSLADSAFAFACNSYNALTVAQGADINFVAPARIGDVLIAQAREVTRGERSGVYDIEVRIEGGGVVALFRGRSRTFPDKSILLEEA